MSPEVLYDFWTILFFSISLFGIAISIYLFIKKSNSKLPYIFLGLYTLIHSYQIFEYDLFWSRMIFYMPAFANIAPCMDFLATPLLYLFFKTLFEYRSFRKEWLLHFVPFIIAVLSKIPYFSLELTDKIYFYDNTTNWYRDYIVAQPWIGIFQMMIYLFIMMKMVKSHYSIGSVKLLSYGYLILFGLIVVSNILYFSFAFTIYNNALLEYNISIILSIGVIVSGWFGIISPAVFNGLSIKDALISIQTYTVSYDFKYDFLETYKNNLKSIKPLSNSYNSTINVSATIENKNASSTLSNTIEIAVKTQPVKYKNSGLTTSAADELKVLLDNFMSTTKAYRENNVALDSLSAKLNTTRHNLSQVINEKYKLNFFDYINMLRINEAKELLCDKKNRKMQVIDVAYRVGYNNKVTFNNAFKKFTGLTPSQYKSQNINE